MKADKCLERLLDVHEIANLQGRYLYYTQSHEYDRVLNLFDLDNPLVSAEISSTGIYEGREKVRALFPDLLGPLFMSPGSLPIHMLTTPVIEVDDTGKRALGMWQTIGCNAFPGEAGMVATWQQGKYDNEFVRTSEGWKFLRFRWLCNFRTPFEKGWVKEPMAAVAPLDLSHFPERCRPTRPSEPYPGYHPAVPMNFGPLPPERRRT